MFIITTPATTEEAPLLTEESFLPEPQKQVLDNDTFLSELEIMSNTTTFNATELYAAFASHQEYVEGTISLLKIPPFSQQKNEHKSSHNRGLCDTTYPQYKLRALFYLPAARKKSALPLFLC